MRAGQDFRPGQSQFGWHIIKVEEKRMSAPPPIEQLQPQLGQQVMFKAFEASVAALKKDLTIDIPDAALAEGVKKQSQPEAEGEAGTAQ